MVTKKTYKKISTDETVTKAIIAEIEQRIKDKTGFQWIQGWTAKAGTKEAGYYFNPVTKNYYSGVNVFILSILGARFADPRYITYKNAKDLGGNVKLGQRGIPIVYVAVLCMEHKKPFNKITNECPQGCDKDSKKFIINKHYTVFNVEQCENLTKLKPLEVEEVEELTEEFDPISEAERIVSLYKNAPSVEHDGGDGAYYIPATDEIHLPTKNSFHSNGEYYSTLFHELVHSTLHPSRLNRSFKDTPAQVEKFGSAPYAKEELVAELGNSLLCSRAGITDTYQNSIEYLRGWVAKLNDDMKLFISSARHANKAVKYMTGE